MRKSIVKKAIFAILATGAAMGSTAASAEDWHYFNDGNGNCGYVSCGNYGCAVVMTFPCPNEVRGDL